MDKIAHTSTPVQVVVEGQREVTNKPSPAAICMDQSPNIHIDNNPDQSGKKLGFSIEDILRRSNNTPPSHTSQQYTEQEEGDSPHYVTSARDERCLSRDGEDEAADVTFDQSEEDECMMAGGEEVECGEGYSWLHCTRYKPPKLPRSKRKDTNKKRKLGRNPRVPFTQHQVSVLEQKFRQTHYLSSVDVAELSATLNLTETRVKIWFQNRRARERRDKTSPTSIDKDLSPGHFKERAQEVVTSLPAESRLQPKYSGGPTEEQFKAMGAHHPFNVLHTAWGGVYHPLHGLFGIRPLGGVQHYDSHQQRALAQQRMLALQRHSAFTPVMHGLNGLSGPNRQVSSTD